MITYTTTFPQGLPLRNSTIPMVFSIPFFSLSLLDCSPLLFSSKRSCPSLFVSPPPFIGLFLALIYTAILLLAKLLGIFFFILSISSPPLSLNSNSWGMFVLLRLSYMDLIWQRLGRNLFFNAEEKIFKLLRVQTSYVVLGIFWKLYVDHPCTLLQIRLISYLFHGIHFPVLFSPFKHVRWFGFFSLTTHCPLGLSSNIRVGPSLFPAAHFPFRHKALAGDSSTPNNW